VPTKILVVDDSTTARFPIVQALTSAGFEVVQAENGDEGLKMLEAHPEIRLVITDINMPWKDGIEMLQEIRAGEPTKELPVIILSTESGGDALQRARALGVKGYLTKPPNLQHVVSAVRKIVGEAA
jgi:two-component system chemotaxis response regulator CheY